MREYLFEFGRSNAGDAVLADILHMPKVKSLPERLLKEVVTGPVAYWAERFLTESGVTTAPVEIC